MTCQPILPLEVQLLVIECFGDDRYALRSASRISRTWRAACYRRLFSSIDLNLLSIQSFSVLLRNEFTALTIPSCVRHLSIDLRRSNSGVNPSQYESLKKTLEYFSRVTGLGSLTLLNTRASDIQVYTALRSGFPNISLLCLSNCSFGTLTELMTLVSSHAQVQQLVLKNLKCHASGVLHPSPYPTGSYRLQLTASPACGLSTSLHWRRQISIPTKVEDLELLATVSLTQLGNVNLLLQNLGACLTYFEFFYPLQNDAPQILLPYNVDLRHATHLQQLVLGFPDRVLGVMPWILSILDGLKHCTLRELRIYFSASRQFSLDVPFLRSLDEVLCRSQFEKVDTIRLLAFHSLADEEVKRLVVRHVSECLVDWHKDGKLRVTFPA